MSVKIHRSFSGTITCPDGHDHGDAVVHLTWTSELPVAIDVELEWSNMRRIGLKQNTYTLPAERDVLARCVAYGDLDHRVFGVAGQGVTFKLRESDSQRLTICWPVTMKNGRAGLLCTVDRMDVGEFLGETYDAVPAGTENLDLDRVAARLLYS